MALKQRSFSSLEQAHKKKQAKREVFLGEIEAVVPWVRLEALIAPHYRAGQSRHVFRVIKCQFGYRRVRYRGLMKNGAQVFSPPFGIMLRITLPGNAWRWPTSTSRDES